MPASWYAVFFFSSSVEDQSIFRSTPIITLSLATSKSYCNTDLRFVTAAIRAASFTRLAKVRAGETGRTAGSTES